MHPRLAKLKKLLEEAIDNNDSQLYIDDLKLSIEHEKNIVINVYETATGYADDD